MIRRLLTASAIVVVLSTSTDAHSQSRLEGYIDARMVAAAETLTTPFIELNSDGGDVVAGVQLAELFYERDWHAHIPEGATCASACTLAWLYAPNRSIAPSGAISFHSPTYAGPPPTTKAEAVAISVGYTWARDRFLIAALVASPDLFAYLFHTRALYSDEPITLTGAQIAEHFPDLLILDINPTRSPTQ